MPGDDVWRVAALVSQLTRMEGVSFDAVWMPDSRSIIHSIETPVYDLRRLPIDGSTPQMLVATPFDKKAGSVSPDGRIVAYFDAQDRDRLMSAPTLGGGAGKPELMGASDNAQANASFSPDGKWLTYEQTPTSEAMQAYVRPLGRDGGHRQVSADGGSQPRWSKNGREIVYRKGDAMFAASFDPQSGEVGTPSGTQSAAHRGIETAATRARRSRPWPLIEAPSVSIQQRQDDSPAASCPPSGFRNRALDPHDARRTRAPSVRAAPRIY